MCVVLCVPRYLHLHNMFLPCLRLLLLLCFLRHVLLFLRLPLLLRRIVRLLRPIMFVFVLLILLNLPFLPLLLHPSVAVVVVIVTHIVTRATSLQK